MLKLFFWLRYLRKIKIVLLSIGAVGLSSGLLIVVASLFCGFIEAFEASAVDVMGDIVIMSPMKFGGYDDVINRLEKNKSVKAATAVLGAQGLLHLGRAEVRAVEVWGIEPDKRDEVSDLGGWLLGGKGLKEQLGQARGLVGIGVVCEPDEKNDEYDFEAAKEFVGRRAVLTTGTIIDNKAGESAGFKRKVLQFEISDIVYTGIYGIDKGFIYLPIEQLQELLYADQGGRVASQIQIKLEEGSDTQSALAQIRGIWKDFAAERLGWSGNFISYTDVETSRQLQSRYVVELKKQMGVLLLIFGVISFGVVVLVFSIFYMIVVTRLRDIAIIKSFGGSNLSVALIFLGFGGCVGLAGSALGVLTGYVVTTNINAIEHLIRLIFGLKLWKSSVYLFSRIPEAIDWEWAFLIAVFSIIAASAGALIPAVSAAMKKPVEILRYE